MEGIALRFVYDRNKRASDSKQAPLLIEVRVVGTNQCVYVNTGIKLYPKQFSTKDGFTCINHDKANLVTVNAKKILGDVGLFAYSDECLSLADIKNYNQIKTYNKDVIEFIRGKLLESNPTINVLKRHNVLIHHLENFGEIRYFNDLTFEKIERFDFHLKKTINATESLYKMHSIFRKYIDKAVNLGLCKVNPYNNFKFIKGKNVKEPTFLTEEEVNKIKNFKTDNEKLIKVRDLFIFQCYTGLAYVDLMNFSSDWIIESDGYKMFSNSRSKTDVRFTSLLLPEAENILLKYYGKLPKLSNQKYNDYLKIIEAGAKLKKHLTTHVARHTFATYLLNNDVPIETVSRAVGHTSIKQTEHYAKLLNKKIVSDMKKLL